MKKITLCVPCYKRPQRTLRAMECVVNQDMNGWEAYFVGDGCAAFQNLLDTKQFEPLIQKAEQNGNKLYVYNLENHSGGWGHDVRNHIIAKANSEYTIFMDNDDLVETNHFSNYYETIKATENDFMYFDTFIVPYNHKRDAQIRFGSIGHHEIIVKTELLKKMPKQTSFYGHDWTLVENIVRTMGVRYSKAENKPTTYLVKALGEFRTDDID